MNRNIEELLNKILENQSGGGTEQMDHIFALLQKIDPVLNDFDDPSINIKINISPLGIRTEIVGDEKHFDTLEAVFDIKQKKIKEICHEHLKSLSSELSDYTIKCIIENAIKEATKKNN